MTQPSKAFNRRGSVRETNHPGRRIDAVPGGVASSHARMGNVRRERPDRAQPTDGWVPDRLLSVESLLCEQGN